MCIRDSSRVIVAGGMESMSNAPHFARSVKKGEGVPYSSLESVLIHDGLQDAFTGESMGNTGETIAEEHGISREQLVDMGIMIGTDFHPGIKGIGPKTGLKLIQKHGTMEAIAEARGFDLPEDLDAIRDLFMEHPAESGSLPEPTKAVEEGLRSFLQGERGCSERRMDRALGRLSKAGRLRSASQPTLFDF